MRTKRSTFRRTKRSPGHGTNTAALARRSWNETLSHYRFLHDPKRSRSPSELDTMRAAARRRPHGFAAAYLAAISMPPPVAPKKRTRAKKAA